MINIDNFALGEVDSQAAPVCNGTVRELLAEIKRLREALEGIKEYAEEHPVFMGYEDDISEQDIIDEGGDAAFVTLDIAWKAKKALE